MNLQQSKDLFVKTILPFSFAGGVLIFCFTLLLMVVGYNPLAGSPYGYRDIDLILLIVFISVLLIRYNYQFPGNTPFWEIFFIAFISAMVALLLYLILTLILSYFSTGLLINLADENKKFAIQNKNEIIEKVGVKGFVESLNNIRTITPGDLFFSELVKKGIATMFLSAFMAIAFRFSNLVFLKKKLK